MDVGEENLDFAASAKEVCDFDHGSKVAAVRATGGCGPCGEFVFQLWVFCFATEKKKTSEIKGENKPQ